MKKLVSLIIIAVLIFSSLPSCTGKEAEFYEDSFLAMDTFITLKLSKKAKKGDDKKEIELDEEYYKSTVAGCQQIVCDLDTMLSAQDENSLTYEVNGENDVLFDVDEEFCSLVEKSYEISEKTNNSFDITIGAATLLWNISSDNPHIATEEETAEALCHIGRDKITVDGTTITKTDREAKLDFGAIGKGYALSKLCDYLESTDILYGLVSFGGNVAVFGSRGENEKYKIGIADPADTEKVVGYAYIDSGYVSVSGDYERYTEIDGVKYNHIFDPATAVPAKSDLSCVAVICKDGSLADALSTALFVMGSENALEFYKSGVYEFEAVIITSEGEMILTDGIAPTYDEKTGEEIPSEGFEKYVPEEDKTENTENTTEA